ncbi:MAG: PhoI [Thermococci archaeon]|nr:PhoI [Thermococci archaeon]
MEVDVERMQVFFPASLEIQEELLKAGFKVPYDKESGRKAPIPVVASYSGGRTIRRERLLRAEKYDDDGRYVRIGRERTILKVDINDRGFVTFTVKPVSYHLEDVGFTTVPPRLWGTWVSLSLRPENMWRIYDSLPSCNMENRDTDGQTREGEFRVRCGGDGGNEIEIYAYKGRNWKSLGIPVFAYGFGLKGLPMAMEYLEEVAGYGNVDVRRLHYMKLGLKKLKETKAGLKVGIGWSEGELKRFSLKLSTAAPRIQINGLYGELTGKSRGGLAEVKEWHFTVHGSDLKNATDALIRTVGLRH